MIGNTNRAEIRLKLSLKDEDTINRFCECLKLNKNKKEYLTDEGGRKQAMIRFRCKKMSSDLIRHGLKFRKSKIIEYPKLPIRDLELAFLLGYYDGDGRRNTTIIISGSRRFLEQVKNRFNLPYKIYVDKREKEIYGRKIKGTNYLIHLGSESFNKMMTNYKNSMTRKRWFPCERKDLSNRAKEACTLEKVRERNILQQEWRAIKKEELERLVQEMPLRQIAVRYNVSPTNTVSRKCRRLGILLPERGYWTEVYWAKSRSLGRKAKPKQ